MNYEKKDYYHKKAKEEGYLARSAYKLKEIQEKFSVFRSGQSVLDLGCSPGAWSQVIVPLVGKSGQVVGIDLEECSFENPRFRFILGDAFALRKDALPESPFQVVVSDMAPKTSGIKIRDHARSIELCEHSLALARDVLIPGGSIIVKVFEGSEIKEFSDAVRGSFEEVKLFRPKSTRQASVEIYLIGLRKKQTTQQ